MPRRIEPAHVSNFGGEGHGDEKRSAAHRLTSLDHWRHRPVRRDEGELLLKAAQALERILDRINTFLKDDLLRSVLELLIGQPTGVRQGPVATAAVNPAVAQQGGKQLLAFTPKVVPRGLVGAHKIANRPMSRIGRPTLSFRRPMQRQCDRIPTVRLDPLTRSFRDQRRSNHHAVMPERLNLAIQPVSRWSGLEADMQTIVTSRQSLDRPFDRQRIVLDIAKKPDFPGPAALRDRNPVLLLGDIESDKDFAILFHGPLSVHEARLGPARATLVLPARKGGPPTQTANMTSSGLDTATRMALMHIELSCEQRLACITV